MTLFPYDSKKVGNVKKISKIEFENKEIVIGNILDFLKKVN